MTDARALLVDDEPAARRNVKDMLGSLSIVTSEVVDRDEAIALLKHESFDFVFVDIALSASDGMSLIEQAIQWQPDANTIVMGSPSFHASVEALRRGVFDYLAKPVTLDSLLAVVQRARQTRKARVVPAVRTRSPARPRAFEAMVISSAEMRSVRSMARKLAGLDNPVMIYGENGVGKTRFARLIHENSAYREGPLVHVRCTKACDGEFDRTLFAPDAPAGPHPPRSPRSVFEQAKGGSLLLANVEQLPMWGQVKLLEAIEQQHDRRVIEPRSAARLVATTTGDLKTLVNQGEFLSDLYFRLNVSQLRIPPLRQRPDDLRALAEFFLIEHQRAGRSAVVVQVAPEAWPVLLEYPWPGNVAELVNLLERALLETSGETISREAVERLIRIEGLGVRDMETITVPMLGDMKAMERHIVREVINRCSGNKAAAARRLGIHRKSIYRLLQHEPTVDR